MGRGTSGRPRPVRPGLLIMHRPIGFEVEHPGRFPSLDPQGIPKEAAERPHGRVPIPPNGLGEAADHWRESPSRLDTEASPSTRPGRFRWFHPFSRSKRKAARRK